jgi:hypothetical protein
MEAKDAWILLAGAFLGFYWELARHVGAEAQCSHTRPTSSAPQCDCHDCFPFLRRLIRNPRGGVGYMPNLRDLEIGVGGSGQPFPWDHYGRCGLSRLC